MIKASVAYEMMEKALHLIPSHESNSTYLSAYGVFNLESGDCVAVRAANHGTFLYNWLKMQDKPFNVDLLTSANIAITFLDGSIPFSQNNNIEMDNGAEPPVFVVRQYVYNCAVLDTNDINVIISASKKLIVDGVYTDPFEEDGTKHAIIYREKTNEPPKDVTAKTLKKHRAAKKKREQHTDNNQELNTEQYMNKKLIKLTEGDLKQIVKESIGRVINEAYGTPDSDTKSALDNLYTAQYYGDKEDLKHSNYYYPHKPYERLQHFRKSILEMEMDLSALFRDDGIKSGDPYFYALSNHVQAMKEISERLIRKLKMEQGEQPDEDYNNRHLSRPQRNRKAANDLSNWKNGEDRHDYSGLAGWGG